MNPIRNNPNIDARHNQAAANTNPSVFLNIEDFALPSRVAADRGSRNMNHEVASFMLAQISDEGDPKPLSKRDETALVSICAQAILSCITQKG